VWYVYFLELANGDIYVGSTNDLRRRVKSHDDGQVLSTRFHLPAVLKSYVAVETEAVARALERYFKSGSGKAVAKKRFFSRSTAPDPGQTLTPAAASPKTVYGKRPNGNYQL